MVCCRGPKGRFARRHAQAPHPSQRCTGNPSPSVRKTHAHATCKPAAVQMARWASPSVRRDVASKHNPQASEQKRAGSCSRGGGSAAAPQPPPVMSSLTTTHRSRCCAHIRPVRKRRVQGRGGVVGGIEVRACAQNRQTERARKPPPAHTSRQWGSGHTAQHPHAARVHSPQKLWWQAHTHPTGPAGNPAAPSCPRC